MDEVTGNGDAELLDGGSIKVVFAYHNGDEATLKAIRNTSSLAACKTGFDCKSKAADVTVETLIGTQPLLDTEFHRFTSIASPVPRPSAVWTRIVRSRRKERSFT